MSRGGFQKLRQDDFGDDEERLPIGGTIERHPQLFTGIGSNSMAGVAPSSSFQPFEVTVDVEPATSSKATNFWRVSAALVSLSGLLALTTLSSHYAALRSGPPDLQELKHRPPLSVIFDEARYRYRVIDNYPLLKPNKEFNDLIGIGTKSDEHVLAYGTCARNVNGNGWNYLSAQAVDLSTYSIADSVLPGKDGKVPSLSQDQYDDLINQQYFRTLEAIGYLEGYSTCVEMNEWYVNFYSGMFDGGNPTDESMEFLLANHDWMVEQSNLNWQTSDYWRTVRGMLSQLAGIVNGANAGCPGDESTLAQAEQKVYLNDLTRQHSIIHMLLLNANGDMYQLDDKFSQYLSSPSDVLVDIPNDDGYFFELANNATQTKKDGDKEGSAGSGRDKSGGRGGSSAASSTHEGSSDSARGYYYSREEGRKRIEAKKAAREGNDRKGQQQHHHHGAEVKTEEQPRVVGGHLRSRRSQRRLSELYAAEAAAAVADCATEASELTAEGASHRRLNMITHRHDHCSALIKLLDDKSDVLFGHDTWDDFQNAAPRIFKHYTMNLMNNCTPSGLHEVQFSSSPGMVTSNDDYFVSRGNARIAVIETTIDMSNRTLLNDIVPQSMLSWGRSHIANQLAVDGKTWCDWFSMYHSGTYVNQWMVLNFDLFTPLVGPQPGFLHVLEEVPTFIHYADVTQVLIDQGYWASYNEPYFADIAQLSLDAAYCQSNPEFCYNTDPRAEIFKANQGKIEGIKDMQWMMGYNNFQNDPLSLGDSCQSIACRNDLQPNATKAYPFGAIDSKISSVMLSSRPVPITVTRLGPTHDEQEPFCWAPWDARRNNRGEKFHHAGHPPCFDFDWQTMPPFAEV